MKVSYISHSGSDRMVVAAARVSMNRDDLSTSAVGDKDTKLIQYLAEHQHTSPFEHCHLTCLVEAPLFIAAQWMRHRTQSFNQISRRYTAEEISFWTPDRWRRQSESNRQASTGNLDAMAQESASAVLANAYETAEAAYQSLLAMGVCREQARAVLPQGLVTRFYASASLHNWTRFIKLRDHDGAQKEIQSLAQEVAALVKEYFPVSGAALLD